MLDIAWGDFPLKTDPEVSVGREGYGNVEWSVTVNTTAL
jgi:hypothetical protein